MAAGWAVEVVADWFDLGADRAPDEELTDIQFEILSLGVKHRCDEQLHSLMEDDPILGEVFALEVSVDRHLGVAASAYGRDIVDGRLTAALEELRFGFWRH